MGATAPSAIGRGAGRKPAPADGGPVDPAAIAYNALPRVEQKLLRRTVRMGRALETPEEARMAVALQLTLSQLLEGIELDAAEVRALPRSQRGPQPMEGRDSTSS